MRSATTSRLPRPERGVTLVELAVVVALLGALVGAGWLLAGPLSGRALSLETGHQLIALEQGLERFVAETGRLPCPDADADGFEDCGAAHVRLGGVPYRTLGVEVRGRPAAGRLLYGADPALQARPAGSVSEWRVLPGPLHGFCAALAGRLPAGPRADALTVAVGGDCEGPASYRPAFVLVSAGRSDADGDGDALDGRNAAAAGGFGSCIEAPARAGAADYDDRVHAVGAFALYGALCSGRPGWPDDGPGT